MAYSKSQIEKHIKTARILDSIKDKAFLLIKNSENISEFEVHNFILEEFRKNNLITNENNCIVSFRENTSNVHYFPKQACRESKDNSLIMIDLWACFKEIDSPYTDITWMAYKGEKAPKKIQEIFDLVLLAREEAINFIKASLREGILPIGKEIDAVARKIIHQIDHGGHFNHTLGHSVGMCHPHGELLGLAERNKGRLKKMQVYTIEPGIYIKNKFGIRSEIDFYINDDLKFILTTKKQDKIVLL